MPLETRFSPLFAALLVVFVLYVLVYVGMGRLVDMKGCAYERVYGRHSTNVYIRVCIGMYAQVVLHMRGHENVYVCIYVACMWIGSVHVWLRIYTCVYAYMYVYT